MADNQLAQVVAGKTGFVSQVNQYFSALTVNFLPRSIAGTVADLAGSVGETTRRWSNGFFKVFTVKADNSEIIFQENAVSEKMEIVADGTSIVEFNDKMLLPKLKNVVTNSPVFTDNDILVSQETISSSIVTKTIYTRVGAVIDITATLAVIVNSTSVINIKVDALGVNFKTNGTFVATASTHLIQFQTNNESAGSANLCIKEVH